jgi:hypothetical protein
MLVALIEPVKIYRRGEAHPITQMTPLTRLVDAARADSRAGREFAAVVSTLLDDAPHFKSQRERVLDMLSEWREVLPAVRVAANKSPIMRDAEPLAAELSEMSEAGLEAVRFLSENLATPANWRDERLALLDGVAKEKREVEFPIITPLRRLIHAAAELPQLKTLPASEWKARVTKLAEEKR